MLSKNSSVFARITETFSPSNSSNSQQSQLSETQRSKEPSCSQGKYLILLNLTSKVSNKNLRNSNKELEQ